MINDEFAPPTRAQTHPAEVHGANNPYGVDPELWERLPPALRSLDPVELAQRLSAHLDYQEKYNRLDEYKPNAKQREFHKRGATFRERMLFGANRSGKTFSGAREVAYHVLGDYPDWWEGKRYEDPNEWWIASEDYELLRDVGQRMLMGPPDEIGSGAIPKNRIIKPIIRAGIQGALDTVLIRHKSGGVSRLKFKSYKEGRAEFQGASVRGVWFDEEPKSEDRMGIYLEALTRTNDQRGMVIVTFTPLLGTTQLVNRFVVDKFAGTTHLTLTIWDAEHYTQAEKEAIVAQYPEHERAARTMGEPKLGSGAVFAGIDMDAVKYKSAELGEIPSHWYRLCGQDYGLRHPTTLVWIAHNRDEDTYWVYDVHCASDTLPAAHYDAWLKRGKYIPVAWPPDGRQREKGTGIQLAQRYRDLGMEMLETHAMLPQAPAEREKARSRLSVEAGVMLISEAMREGRFRIASHLEELWDEIRAYHRDERGQIVAKNDDVISGMRYAFVMLMSGHGVQKAGERYTFDAPRQYGNSRYG